MAKRALIVDDSKSARLSLARILEKHAIEVDTAESAELAIEYLGTHRPDAIFMDHMMGGMDGLQAVQLIKNNPRTATIPIMMYTSQEGELYVSQARALGAIGVMPKQVKPADVTKVLYQLNLAADRRSNDTGTFRAAVEHLHLTAAANEPHGYLDTALPGNLLREQLLDLRRTILAGFDNQGDRLLADLRTVLNEASPGSERPGRMPHRPWLPWLLTAALAGACVVFIGLFWHQSARLSAIEGHLAQLTSVALPASDTTLTPAGSASTSTPPAPATASATGPRTIVQIVPYGAEPFGGVRLDTLRQLFDRLTAQGYQGSVDIRTFGGRFCLVGNATEGYSLAPDDLPYAKCDMVSGPRNDPTGGVRIPVVMADLMGTVRASSHDMIHVQVTGGDGGTVAAYPAVSDGLTAGEWNRAAGVNNRIEIRVH